MIEYFVGLWALLRFFKGFQFFLIRRRSKIPIKTMGGASPFMIKKGKKVALLIHGFTTSPKEFRNLGGFLSKGDISVYAPLLPGHGTSPERLSIIKSYQWVEFIEEQIRMLSKDYNEIFLVGNSFGGNLALVNANVSKKVKGVITLATPIFFYKERFGNRILLPLLKSIKVFQKKKYSSSAKRVVNKGVAYDSIPLNSISHVLRVVKLSKKSLKSIRKPLLVMQVDGDEIVDVRSSEFIMSNSPSKNKEVFTVPKSYHVFILDKYAKVAYKRILEFIKKY